MKLDIKSVLAALVLFSAGIFLFASSDDNTWTAEERVNANGVITTMTNLTAATRISNELGGSIINRKDLMTIIGSLRTALDDARSVENNVLDKIHSNLRAHWRNELEQGLELRLKNLESTAGDPTAEFEGAAKLDRFGVWWNANKAELRVPKLK